MSGNAGSKPEIKVNCSLGIYQDIFRMSSNYSR